MTRKRAVAILILLTAAPAHAGELAGDRHVQITEISPADCAQFATLEPNGEADYQPGVAADGSPVAPADVDGSVYIAPPEKLTFKARVAPLPSPSDRFNRSYIDTIEIEIDPRTGRVTLDGQEVDGAAHEIADACAKNRVQ